jgi:hypothetical protein
MYSPGTPYLDRDHISEAFIIGLPFIGGTQEAKLTGLIDYEKVF